MDHIFMGPIFALALFSEQLLNKLTKTETSTSIILYY